jgi:iron(III) transport system ATP-binding protein
MSVVVRGLRKRFGDHVAADDIDLDVPAGGMLVLLGPSGCGKTTTMRCIAGLETPDAGTVEVGGRVVFDVASRINMPVNRRRIGMVFQSYAIWPHMTVFENVGFPLQMERVPGTEIRRRVLEMLGLVGLEGLADRGASALSGGQMQRVALARSLVMQPTLLLFDEPLSNVDARLRDQLRVLLRELQMRLGITGVYVTHDQSEAFAIADQVAVMAHGHIRQITDPVNLYRAPATSEIAKFIGYTNVFPARFDPVGNAGCATLTGTGQSVAVAGAPQAADFDLCVRPDAIRLVPADAAAAVRGQITMVSFMGAQRQIHVRSACGDLWEILDPLRFESPCVGAEVALHIDPDQILLLPRQ